MNNNLSSCFWQQ